MENTKETEQNQETKDPVLLTSEELIEASDNIEETKDLIEDSLNNAFKSK